MSLGEYRDKPDEKTLLLGHILWQEAATRGIRMREFRVLGVPTNSFTATFRDGSHLSFDSIPTLPHFKKPLWWLDNKAQMKKRFRALGLPVARGEALYSLSQAKKILQSIGGAVVVKPFQGSASRHTTLHVRSEQELERAFDVAKQISPLVVVEEELPGAVYRPTLLDGSLIATLRRDQPQVVGDGIHTVEELVARANTHPKRQGPYFSKISLAEAAHKELAYQGLTSTSVPKAKEKVILHQKISWSLGGTTTDVTPVVHPDNKRLFEYVARVLNAHIVGIDIIMEDIGRPYTEQRCGIIECNGRPFFDNHHLPFEGDAHNVAKVIWDYVEPRI